MGMNNALGAVFFPVVLSASKQRGGSIGVEITELPPDCPLVVSEIGQWLKHKTQIRIHMAGDNIGRCIYVVYILPPTKGFDVSTNGGRIDLPAADGFGDFVGAFPMDFHPVATDDVTWGSNGRCCNALG